MKAAETVWLLSMAWIASVGVSFTPFAGTARHPTSAPSFAPHPPPRGSGTTAAFTPFHRERSSSSSSLTMIPFDVSSLLTCSVEVFDGSTLVDPGVVSSAFATSLQTKFLSVLVGQFLAAIVFSFFLSLVATQVSNLTQIVTDALFPNSSNNNNKSDSGRTDTLKIPRDLRDTDNGTTTVIQPDFGKLLVCLAVDIIGTSSELIPVLGELTDVVWAPVAGLILRNLFGGSNVVFALEVTEEILPLTDILPLATLCWVVETFFGESDVARALQLGRYSATGMQESSSSSSPLNDLKDASADKRYP